MLQNTPKRELTYREKQAIRKLVKQHCANYDRQQRKCLPLECECYMFTKHYTGTFCRYFQNAVLPLESALEVALLRGEYQTGICRGCNRPFLQKQKTLYCSEACKEKAQRKLTAKRVRKHRANKECLCNDSGKNKNDTK